MGCTVSKDAVDTVATATANRIDPNQFQREQEHIKLEIEREKLELEKEKMKLELEKEKTKQQSA